MASLDTIKRRLKTFFISKVISPDDLPMHIFQTQDGIFYQYQHKKTGHIWTARSEDGFDFELTNQPATKLRGECPFPHAHEVPGQSDICYFGDRSIRVARREADGTWKQEERPIIESATPLQLAAVFPRQDGNLLVYFGKQTQYGMPSYAAYIALVDKDHPDKLLWELQEPIWQQDSYWKGKSVVPLGVVVIHDTIISYWYVDQEIIYGVAYAGFLYDPQKITHYQLQKHVSNPIIVPNEENDWEAFTTLNPAALQAGGKVHILYRAQGYDYVSSVGYARSSDGISIEHRSEKPVYAPHEGFETNVTGDANPEFISAGGYGGCEDPRVTQIEDRVYMTYVAFDGWSPPRLALTSIHINDFLAERWNWEKPVLISRPGIVDKSGCLLPEKINGKYVIFHRVFPNIQIDFVDDLNFDGKTNFLKGEHEIKIRENMWDSRKIGAGAPPLKTKDGWLLIYYGVDDRDDSKYLVGAMLLDLKDPTKVLYRTDHPIIEPVEHYENIGFKPGIVYPCGAIIKNGQLLVYYGGADQHVCVAGATLDEFLDKLKHDETPTLHTLEIREVTYQ